jgi:transcriptional regulator with XRE-family HTH domain
LINSVRSKNLREFGRRLTAYREASGMSRLCLANVADVSQEHIWRLENGFRGCSRDLAIIISSRLNLNMEQINELLLLTGHHPVRKKGDSQRTRFLDTKIEKLSLIEKSL